MVSGPSVPSGGFSGTFRSPDEINALAQQVASQRSRLGLPTYEKKHESFMDRLFDVLQRPLYASAETAQNLVNAESVYDVLGAVPAGVTHGLAGTQKTTYSDVLADVATKSWTPGGEDVTGLEKAYNVPLALAGDIFLDPSTYVGLEALKPLSSSKYLKRVEMATSTAMESARVKRIGQEAYIASRRAGAIDPVFEEIATKAAQEAGTVKTRAAAMRAEVMTASKAKKEAMQTAAYNTGLRTQDRGMGSLSLTFRGKPLIKAEGRIGTAYRPVTEPWYKAGRLKMALPGRVATPAGYRTGLVEREIMKFPIVHSIGERSLQHMKDMGVAGHGAANVFEALNKKFRTASKAVYGEANELKRMFESVGVGRAEELTSDFKNAMKKFGKLSKADRNAITHHREHKTVETLLKANPMGTQGANVYEAAKYVERELEYVTSSAITNNTMDPLYAVDNWVPHYFKAGSDPNAIKAAKRTRRTSVEKRAREEAELLGKDFESVSANHFISDYKDNPKLKPHEDIIDIVSMAHHANQREIANRRMADAFVGEFGLKIGKKNKFLVDKMGLKQISKEAGGGKYIPDNVWFPEEIAHNIQQIEDVWGNAQEADKLMDYYDKVLSYWKFGNTVLSPAHHIRNIIGDVYLNWLDGVRDPKVYSQAINILNAHYSTSTRKVMTKIGDLTLDEEWMMRLFIDSGAKPGFFRTEYADAGLNVMEKIRQFSEYREETTRMAHFIDVLKKEGGKVKTYDDALAIGRKEAGRRVRKFNIDYGDLTDFEKTWMKRIIPFYTFTRKNIPLQIEMLLSRPEKLGRIPKGLRALEQLTGQESEEPQIMGVNVLPEWLAEASAVALLGEGQGRNGIYWNPTGVIPALDLSKYLEGSKGSTGSNAVFNVLGETNPVIQSILQYGMGQNLQTGGPREESASRYATEALLPSSISTPFQLLTGRVPPGAKEVMAEEGPLSGQFLPGHLKGKGRQILNYLGIPAGGGFQRLTPRLIRSELRRSQDPLEQEIEARNEERMLALLGLRFGGQKIPQNYLDVYGIGK